MYQLEAVDKAILMILQKGIPFDSRPYFAIGQTVGLTEQEVIERIKRMKEEQIIRRMSGFFNSRNLGYTSVLCAVSVAEKNIAQAAELINSYAGVTHNYVRDHQYNLWFTLIAAGETARENILDEIESSPYVDKMLRLYTNRRFKINVTFDLEV